jgi:hypothetical protein
MDPHSVHFGQILKYRVPRIVIPAFRKIFNCDFYAYLYLEAPLAWRPGQLALLSPPTPPPPPPSAQSGLNCLILKHH